MPGSSVQALYGGPDGRSVSGPVPIAIWLRSCSAFMGSAFQRSMRCGFCSTLTQSVRDISNQIRRVLDADRQPDRGVENAYFLADVGRNAGMGHAGRQAGKRLGAAQAHRQLEDLQRVQEFECGGLAADDIERE